MCAVSVGINSEKKILGSFSRSQFSDRERPSEPKRVTPAEINVSSPPTADTTDHQLDAQKLPLGVKFFLIGAFLLTMGALAISYFRGGQGPGVRRRQFVPIASNLRCTSADPEAEAVAEAPLRRDERDGIYEHVFLKNKIDDSSNGSKFVFSYVEARSGQVSEKTVSIRLAGDHCDLTGISNGDLAAAKLEQQSSGHENVPSFRIFRQRPGFPVPIVVPIGTADQQMLALVRFFQGKVQTRHFQDVGIAQPTSPKRATGGYDYTSGMIVIYRGEKCAGENFLDEFNGNGPCGYGDHNAASYQWGISGDPRNDAGVVGGRKVF